MPDFELTVSGWKYSGWTSMQITRSMEQLAHSFALSLASKRWDDQEQVVPVKAGDACSIAYDEDQITSGWIDEDTNDSDAESSSVSLTGRSATCDLVDCTAIHKGGQWANRGLLDIAKDLCAPFGLNVYTNVDLGAKFTSFTLQDGETVFQTLDRAAKRRGVLALTRADGNLIFDRVGRARVNTRLEWGKNILQASAKNSAQDRFSRYTVKTQTPGGDSSFGSGTSLARSSVDDQVTRYRPTTIAAEDEDSGSELQKRADWERNVRVGRAKRITYKVAGWEHDTGLWEPNTLVDVLDRRNHIEGRLLIVEAVHVRSESEGTTTSLALTLPQAFDIQPLPPPKAKGSMF